MLFKGLNLPTRVLVLVGLSTGLFGFQTQETPRKPYLVRLTEPSVLQRLLADRRNGRILSVRRGLKSTRVQDYRSAVEASQTRLIGALDPGVRVFPRKSILLNLLVVECSEEAAERGMKGPAHSRSMFPGSVPMLSRWGRSAINVSWCPICRSPLIWLRFPLTWRASLASQRLPSPSRPVP